MLAYGIGARGHVCETVGAFLWLEDVPAAIGLLVLAARVIGIARAVAAAS